MTNCHVFNAERVNLTTALAILLKPHTILPKPVKIGYSLRRGRGESLDCMWHEQTHSIFVPFCKDLARMNGTKSKLTAVTGNRIQISQSWDSILNYWTIPDFKLKQLTHLQYLFEIWHKDLDYPMPSLHDTTFFIPLSMLQYAFADCILLCSGYVKCIFGWALFIDIFDS